METFFTKVSIIFCLTIVCFLCFSVRISSAQSYLQFDGGNDYVEIDDRNALDLAGGSFTLSAWIYPTGWGQNSQGRIMDHGGGSSGNAGWSLHLENKSSKGSPQALRVQINNDSSFNGMSNANALTLNSWQHVAVTFDNGVLTFYINGVQSGIRTGVPTPIQRSSPIRIGRRATDAYRSFEGAIDEVSIWNRALSQGEIQAGMDAGFSGSEAGLIAYYNFDEGSGQTTFDGTASGSDGRLGSTAGTDANDPTWVSGP